MNAETLHAQLTEMQARLDHPLEYMRPRLFELKDPVPSESRPKNLGIVTKSRFDIQKELYNWLMTLPENCVIQCIGWVQEPGEGEPVPAKKTKAKPKPAKGEFGNFWQELFLEMVIGRADFRQWLRITDMDKWTEEVKQTLQVESLTTVSPTMLIDWLLQEAGPDRLTSLRAKIAEIGQLNENFPPGQFFSPWDMGATPPVESEDQKYLKEHLLP